MSSYVVWMLRVISVSFLWNEGGSTQIKCLFKKHPWNRACFLQEDPWHAWHGLSYPKCCQQMLLLSACQSKKDTKSHYKLCLTTFFSLFFFLNHAAELFPSFSWHRNIWEWSANKYWGYQLIFGNQAYFSCVHPLLDLNLLLSDTGDRSQDFLLSSPLVSFLLFLLSLAANVPASSVDYFQSVVDLVSSWSYPISPSA